jgi:protein-tyrosine phosphatase
VNRHLAFDGCFNVRDLGGFRTADGHVTRRGAIVRSDAADRLTAAGWQAVEAHGIRTVVDLRNDGERLGDTAPRPAGLDTVHVPLDSSDDREFWDYWANGPQFGSPVYYRPFLDRFPERVARVVGAIAGARPGGVLFHCGIGRDRTGLVTLVLLGLVGVEPAEIAADYGRSADRVPAVLAARGDPDHTAELDEYHRSEGTTPAEIVVATLSGLDVEAYLRGGGLGDEDVAALRARFLEEARAGTRR